MCAQKYYRLETSVSMGDEEADNCVIFSDSSGDAFVPSSESETEDEQDTDAIAKAPKPNSNEPQKNAHDSETPDEDELISSVISSAEPPTKRRKKDTCGVRVTRRLTMQRNTSHASKIECCDSEEIKNFLRSDIKCCEKQCFVRMRTHKTDALVALAELRHRRFAGKCASP